jgi:transcriptional regulator with XRE-family HTH domain
MRKYDHSLLLGKMREKGYSQERLAKAVGISEVALWNKLHNKTDFTRTEMFTISKVLELDDVPSYFFAM